MRIFTYFLCLFSFSVFAFNDDVFPPHIKTQTDLALNRLKVYFYKQLPSEVLACTKSFMGVSEYQRFLRELKKSSKYSKESIFRSVLKLTDHRRYPRTENQPPFDNNDIGDVCEREYGFCYGYTFSEVLWNRNAHFIPNKIAKLEVPDKSKEPEKWFQFYKERMDDLFIKRKPTIIPDFENLHLFLSSDPRINTHYKKHAALKWAERNISFGGVDILLSIRSSMTKKESQKLYDELSYSINTIGFNPIIYLSSRSFDEKEWKIKDIIKDFKGYIKYLKTKYTQAGIHVVQAFEISPIVDGKFTIKTWDIYSPFDADEAINEIYVDLNAKNADGQFLLETSRPFSFESSSPLGGIRTLDKGSESTSFYADIEQVPFDNYFLGLDVKNNYEFYQKHPEVYSYELLQYEQRQKNPPPKWYPPYKGEGVPPIILKDGSHWFWPEDFLIYNGSIHLTQERKEQLPESVKEILTWFHGEKWKEKKFINPYSFQISEKLYRSKWDLKNIDYKGFITLSEEQLNALPLEDVEKIKERISDKTKFPYVFNLRAYLNDYVFYYVVNDFGEMEAWYWPIDWFNEAEQVSIPSNAKEMIPSNVYAHLDALGVFSVQKPFYVNQLNSSIEIDFGKHSKRIPFHWFDNNGQVTFPSSVEEVDKELVEFFVGRAENWPPKKEINAQKIINAMSYLRYDREDKTLFYIPLDWLVKELDDYDFGFSYIEMPASEKELATRYMPKDVISQIIAPEKYPPNKAVMVSKPVEVYLSNGQTWHFLSSWLDIGPNGEHAKIPEDEWHMIPEKVKEELFMKGGPYEWPPRESYPIYEFQSRPVRFGEPEKNDYWLWPRTWHQKDGSVLIPVGGEKLIDDERVLKRLGENIELPIKKETKIDPWQFEYDSTSFGRFPIEDF